LAQAVECLPRIQAPVLPKKKKVIPKYLKEIHTKGNDKMFSIMVAEQATKYI
jgi:hypothetical protein